MPVKNNIKMDCKICGGKFYLSNRSNHVRTKKHQLCLLDIEPVKNIVIKKSKK
jgi:hypothetical protein